jgi:uncharacterized protein
VIASGVDLALAMSDSYLPVQGPPGSGKTYLGARMVLALVSSGAKVGVTATSHSVIDNLLEEVVQVADRIGQPRPRVGQRVDEGHARVRAAAEARGSAFDSTKEALQALHDDTLDVLGGTVWLWANDNAIGAVDTLIIDEAGQMSLANTLATTAACRNLILLGDPRQLAQPSQGVHPDGAGASSLEHILDGSELMPPHVGLFIPQTRRLHPDLCAFTSEVFYDDQLHSIDGLENQLIGGADDLAGAGLRAIELVHEGNTSWSTEEADAVVRAVKALVGRQWTESSGAERKLGYGDILVVTPFNDQIAEIDAALAAAGITGILVGTVDKFQGREAPITIYSLASSSAETAPHGMEFLYQLNRLNVATSRARSMSIVVASRDLGRVFSKSARQMYLANAFCRARELAIELPVEAPV